VRKTILSYYIHINSASHTGRSTAADVSELPSVISWLLAAELNSGLEC